MLSYIFAVADELTAIDCTTLWDRMKVQDESNESILLWKNDP